MLRDTADQLVGDRRGNLAVDESVSTMSARLLCDETHVDRNATALRTSSRAFRSA